jgi:hypothetical protein
MIGLLFRRSPIAWLQLRYQKAQTAAAILGILFTTVLLFMQIGFRSGFLIRSSVCRRTFAATCSS